jgi:GNAT superfamily N-acetyltransferase
MKEQIKLIKTKSDILTTHSIMKELRPQFSSPKTYVDTIRRFYQEYGYQLVAVLNNGIPKAVAGYRISESLSWGKYLYVDDLVTNSSERSKGYGKKLLDWLSEEAVRCGCKELHLDSGVQRHDAHRFYLRERMDIVFYHFRKSLK